MTDTGIVVEVSVENDNAPKKSAEQLKLDATHTRALGRFHRSEKADEIQAALAKADLEFECGDQWPAYLLRQRKANEQPCMVLNMMPEKISQVVGDQRQNKPEIKVRPVDDVADPETAETLNGLIRAIMANSDGEMITDNAFESQTSCGRGAFRLVTEYESEDSFDQVVKLKWITNVFSVRWDPGAQDYDKQDGKYFFIYQDMQKEDYEEEYPGEPVESLTATVSDSRMATWLVGWTGDTVRVAEYFERVTEEQEIVMLESGAVVQADNIPDGAKVKTRADGTTEYRRKAKVKKIMWYKMNGAKILDGPREFPSQYYPILMAWGKERNIGGKRHIRGMVRDGIDAQRMINYWESKTTEVVALAPTAPFQATKKQVSGHEKLYEAAAKGDPVYVLTYTPDEDAATAMPARVTPPTIPIGMEKRAAVNKDNLKSTMGIYDSSLGAQGNEISGVAIGKRERQAERGTYIYQDNFARTLKTLGKLLLDVIPRIYDADRIVRILGVDGEVRKVKFGERPEEGYNHEELPPEERIFDPKVGRYDVVVTIGTSHETRRTEAAELLTEFVRVAPDIAPIVLPRVAKMSDFPDADELAEDLEMLLPPEIRQMHLQKRGEGEKGSAVGSDSGLLGPDGQPIDPTTLDQGEPEQPQAPVDPTMASKVIAAEAVAMKAVLDMRAAAKKMGLSDKQIDALAAKMKEGPQP